MSSDIDKLINAIANLNEITGNKYIISEEKLSEIITPEWYYSNNIRIFDNIDISWNSLLESDLVKNIALNFNPMTSYRYSDNIFEKSFCTWYQPYHLFPRKKWGIHIRHSSWLKISNQLKKECPNLYSKLNESIVTGFLYLYFHGVFHHIVENAITRIELFNKNPSVFTNYYLNYYLKTFNLSNCIEESLANAYPYEHAFQCHIDKEYLKNILMRQGNAYANFLNFIENKFIKGCHGLILQIKNTDKDLSNFEFKDLEAFFNLNSECIKHNQIPIWLHSRPNPIH